MFLGSQTTSTIFDVFRTGYDELYRISGLPQEICYKTDGYEMRARAADMSKRVDVLKISFALSSGVEEQHVVQAMEETRIGGRVQMSDGTCVLTVPPFEWAQLGQLDPLDNLVEQFAAHTLRSKSWDVEVLTYTFHDISINRYIELMKAERASDLHLRAGSKPCIRVDNDLRRLEDEPVLTPADVHHVINHLGTQREVEKLEKEREWSFQFHAAGVGYLRVSGYYKDGALALAIRLVPEEPLSFEDLNIPDTVRQIADSHRGLFLVCGITGCGKSSTLAAMVEYINQTRPAHIITVEDPVEYVFRDKQSIISQREVGRDTLSFANALRGVLREDPDVVMVGEMRDTETIRAAISAAETGHLVFSTLHTMGAVDTVNRIISFFPPAERDIVRQQLAYTLRGVVTQRLLKHKSGVGRIPTLEILLGGKPIVRDAILDGEISKLYDIMEVDSEMKTFDQYSVDLYRDGLVTKEEAISSCQDLEAFERVISGIQSTDGRKLLSDTQLR